MIALLIEWLVLFVGFPLLAWSEVLPAGIFVIFAAPVLYALLVSFFSPRDSQPGQPLSRRRFALRATAVVAFLFLFCAVAFPDRFLILPRTKPGLWAAIMLFYPLVSALPQEFLYRRFYFARYRSLFPRPWLAAASNVFAFAFLHIIFNNWIAILFSLAGGALFTATYLRTHRLGLVWLEHSLYGLAVFTSGLGAHFYKAPLAE